MSQWEREAAKHHVTLSAPLVTYAVEGLKLDLMTVGVVIDDRVSNTPCSVSDDKEDQEKDRSVPRHYPPQRAMPNAAPRPQSVTKTDETLPSTPFEFKKTKKTF